MTCLVLPRLISRASDRLLQSRSAFMLWKDGLCQPVIGHDLNTETVNLMKVLFLGNGVGPD